MKKKKAPKLFRRKKAGKYVGNWFVSIGDVTINLGTKDAGLAMKNRDDAMRGKRNFVDDATAAADDAVRALAPVPSLLEAPAAETPAAADAPPPVVEAENITPPAAPAFAGSPPPDAPGAPPSESWADAAAAAAGEVGSDGDEEPGKVPPTFHVTMEDIAKILKLPAEDLAQMFVELQIKGGELVANAMGGEVDPIPAEDMGRTMLTVGYVPVVKLLQAEDLKIHPGWFILGGSAMIAATQYRTFRKRDKKPGAPAGT